MIRHAPHKNKLDLSVMMAESETRLWCLIFLLDWFAWASSHHQLIPR